MKVEFTITFKDYKNAVKLHRKQKFVRRMIPWILPSLLAVCIVVFMAASVTKNTAVASQAVAIAAGSITGMIARPFFRFLNMRRCYKQMYPPTRTSSMSTIEIDDQRIVEVNPGSAEVRLTWDGVLDFVRDDTVTMIYFSSHRFFLLPTSAMSESQRAELDDLVARHLPKGKQ
jgi:hypothetical protein